LQQPPLQFFYTNGFYLTMCSANRPARYRNGIMITAALDKVQLRWEGVAAPAPGLGKLKEPFRAGNPGPNNHALSFLTSGKGARVCVGRVGGVQPQAQAGRRVLVLAHPRDGTLHLSWGACSRRPSTSRSSETCPSHPQQSWQMAT
jgi:hypothetical protein